MKKYRWGNPFITMRRKKGTGCISRGYKLITVGNRRIQEHRYVMEKHIGKPVKKGLHVHHKNGNKLDNSLRNLQILTNAEHLRIHCNQRWKKFGKRGWGR